MKKALLLSAALLIVTLACSISGIVDEITGTEEGKRTQSPQEQPSPRQEPTAEYRSHNDPAANEGQSSQNQGLPSPSELVYYDDFSDSTTGWDRQSSDNLYTDYIDGAFHIALYTGFYDAWANPGRYYSGDVQVEVDATLIGGEDDNNFGILCRYSGSASSPNFYFFEISSDGFAVIGKTIDGILEYLSSEKMASSNAINQGYVTNRINADCIGNQLTLYVNGIAVASVLDSSLYDGDVGLIAGAFDAAYTEVAFDNFSVTIP